MKWWEIVVVILIVGLAVYFIPTDPDPPVVAPVAPDTIEWITAEQDTGSKVFNVTGEVELDIDVMTQLSDLCLTREEELYDRMCANFDSLRWEIAEIKKMLKE
jgi:hypothetical protein